MTNSLICTHFPHLSFCGDVPCSIFLCLPWCVQIYIPWVSQRKCQNLSAAMERDGQAKAHPCWTGVLGNMQPSAKNLPPAKLVVDLEADVFDAGVPKSNSWAKCTSELNNSTQEFTPGTHRKSQYGKKTIFHAQSKRKSLLFASLKRVAFGHFLEKRNCNIKPARPVHG